MHAALTIFNNLQHFYLPQTFDHQTGSDLIDAVIIFLVMMKYFSFIYLLLFAIPVTFAQYGELSCYKCDGNNEECSLGTMHADIERFTVKCARDYKSCLTITVEQDGRKIIAKRCANDRICERETKYCNQKNSRKVGSRTAERCDVWCCDGYMCNSVSRHPPAVQLVILLLGSTFVALK